MRKRKKEEVVQIGVKIPKSLEDQLLEIAAKEDGSASLSNVVRKALYEFVRKSA